MSFFFKKKKRVHTLLQLKWGFNAAHLIRPGLWDINVLRPHTASLRRVLLWDKDHSPRHNAHHSSIVYCDVLQNSYCQYVQETGALPAFSSHTHKQNCHIRLGSRGHDSRLCPGSRSVHTDIKKAIFDQFCLVRARAVCTLHLYIANTFYWIAQGRTTSFFWLTIQEHKRSINVN